MLKTLSAAIGVLGFIALAPASGIAAPAPTQHGISQTTDFSAAKRHRHHARHHYRHYRVYGSADPSTPPRNPAYWHAKRTGNRCVEDLGYGRWDYCGW